MFDAWPKLISEVGFPIALTSVLFLFLWRICKFLAPRLSELAVKHGDLVDTLKETQIKQLSLEERQTAMLNDHGVKLDGHSEALRTHREILDEIKQRVTANQCRGSQNSTQANTTKAT